jgi:hypothetical protein
MSNEVVIDGVAYVCLRHFSRGDFLGDPSGFWNRFTEKERDDISRRMMAQLVEAGVYMRKEDCSKENSVYGKDELFYGM